jgi:RHS repeat-associated protein
MGLPPANQRANRQGAVRRGGGRAAQRKGTSDHRTGGTVWFDLKRSADDPGSMAHGVQAQALAGNRFADASPSNASLYGFQGMLQDPATELSGHTSWLYYDNARWYSTFTGDFLSQDPSGYAAGDNNLYRFDGNNPVTNTDPTGLMFATDITSGSILGQAGSDLSGLYNDLNGESLNPEPGYSDGLASNLFGVTSSSTPVSNADEAAIVNDLSGPIGDTSSEPDFSNLLLANPSSLGSDLYGNTLTTGEFNSPATEASSPVSNLTPWGDQSLAVIQARQNQFNPSHLEVVNGNI